MISVSSQKNNTVSLQSFIHEELLNLIPYHDASIVLELLESYLNKMNEFKAVVFSYSDLEFKKNIKQLKLSFDKPFDLIQTLAVVEDYIFMPIMIEEDQKVIIILRLSNKDCASVIINYVKELYFFMTIFMDRIFYISQLDAKNQALNKYNISLKEINKSLKKQLSDEIMSQYQHYDESRKMIRDSAMIKFTRELCHEINNPLSLIQFDLMQVKDQAEKPSIDDELVCYLVNFYKITEPLSMVLKDFKDEKAISEGVLDKFRAYPMLYNYLVAIKTSRSYHQINHNNALAINHIASMVETMAYDSMKKSDDEDSIEVNHLVKESSLLFKNQCSVKSIKLNLKYSKMPCYINVKKVTLMQIILNLVKNSIQSMNDRESKNDSLVNYLEIDIKKEQRYCQISVADTGSGFCDLDLERFVAEGYKPIGLGIPLIKTMVQEIHGDITWQKDKKGTTAILRIPLS